MMPAAAAFAVPAAGAGTPVAALAAADCCQASIQGLPSRFTIGGQPSQFGVAFHNSSQDSIGSFMVLLSFSGNNLSGSQMTLKRLSQDGSWDTMRVSRRNGMLSATDGRFRLGQPLPSGGSTTFSYQLSFDNQTRPTQVHFGVTISGRTGGDRGGDGFTELATAGAQFSVGSVAAPPQTPKATPSPTVASAPPSAAQSAPAENAGPGGPPVTPNDASNNSSGSSLIWIAYIVGALLLLGGIAAMGTLLWRRQPDTAESGFDEDGTAPHFGAAPPYQVASAYPTQPLPAQPSPYGPPPSSYAPPADPYAGPPTTYAPPTEPYSQVPETYGRPSPTPRGRSGRHSAEDR